VNRKLIRPTLAEIKEQRPQHSGAAAASPKKRIPPDQTNAENYYYLKQMAAKTPLVVKLTDGEEIRGVLEWYDKSCIKVHRDNGPNLLILKHNIKYLYKEHEELEKGDLDTE
jgi:sRNA-binding regulator protein Hfq